MESLVLVLEEGLEAAVLLFHVGFFFGLEEFNHLADGDGSAGVPAAENRVFHKVSIKIICLFCSNFR